MNPSTPSGTVTMLATVCPARSVLADDTVGIGEPVGQTDAYPAPSTSTIVRLSTTACTAPGATPVAAATAWVTGASDIDRPAASRWRTGSVRVSSTRIGLIGTYRVDPPTAFAATCSPGALPAARAGTDVDPRSLARTPTAVIAIATTAMMTTRPPRDRSRTQVMAPPYSCRRAPGHRVAPWRIVRPARATLAVSATACRRRGIDGVKFGTPQLGDLDVPVRGVRLVDGEVLVREGDEADDVYVISSGELVATTSSAHGDVIVGRIGEGQVVGEVTVIAGGRRTATLTAAGPAEVQVIRRADFEQWLDDHPDVADAVSAQARERIDRTHVAAMVTDLLGARDPALVQDIVDRVQWRRLEAGDVLFEQGDKSDAAYFIVGGRLMVSVKPDAGGLGDPSPARG